MSKETLQVLVVPAADIRKPVNQYLSGQKAQKAASDTLATYFRGTVMPSAEGDYQKAWKAFSTAVRSLLKAGKDNPEGENTARGILQNVRNRVRDLMPEREGSAAQSAESTVRVNTAKAAPRDLLNSVVSVLSALAAREDFGDLTEGDLSPVITGTKAVLDGIRKQAEAAKAKAE